MTTATESGSIESDIAQRRANERLWRDGNHVREYANRRLRPVEVILLIRYREELSGAVMELGSGAGRLTGYLLELGRSVLGIDLSASMVAYCRRHYPAGAFEVGDLRDVGKLGSARFDVVVAGFNVLDVLDDADRRTVLGAIREVLVPDGLLIMSSHNRDHAGRDCGSLAVRSMGVGEFVATVGRLPRRIRNRRRVTPYEHEEVNYAIFNDSSVDFSALHYYISRDAQERQFVALGFTLIECLDLEGHSVEPGGTGRDSSELHYVARRT